MSSRMGIWSGLFHTCLSTKKSPSLTVGRPSTSALAANSFSSLTTRRSESEMPSERIWKMNPL